MPRKISKTLLHMMDHVVRRSTSIAIARSFPATTSVARRAPPRSGTPRRKAWKQNLFNYSFVGYISREAGTPDLVVAVRIEEGTPDDRAPRPLGDARHVVRALPAHRDQRDHDARPPPHRTVADPIPVTGPVTEVYGTLAAVSDADPSHPGGRRRTPRSRSSPTTSSACGRPAARAVRSADPWGRGRFAPRPPGQPVRGAAGRTHRRPPPPRRRRRPRSRRAPRHAAARRPPPRRRRHDRPCGGRLAALGASRRRWRRRFDPLVVGITGEHRQDVDEGGGGDRPRRRPKDAQERGQPEQRDRAAADAAAARPGARGRRPRDGHVRGGRDRRPRGDGAAVDRRRHRGPGRPPVADRLARGDRAGEGRAARGTAVVWHGRPERR